MELCWSILLIRPLLHFHFLHLFLSFVWFLWISGEFRSQVILLILFQTSWDTCFCFEIYPFLVLNFCLEWFHHFTSSLDKWKLTSSWQLDFLFVLIPFYLLCVFSQIITIRVLIVKELWMSCKISSLILVVCLFYMKYYMCSPNILVRDVSFR